MDNPEKLATLGTQDKWRRQKTHHRKHLDKQQQIILGYILSMTSKKRYR